MALRATSCPGQLLRGLWGQWEHPECPKVSQTAQGICISATKFHPCQCSLQSCMAYCVAFPSGKSIPSGLPSRLCWLPQLHLCWLKWECGDLSWHQTFGAYSIPPLTIRQSKLGELAASCGAPQIIVLNHVCPVSRQVWPHRQAAITLMMIMVWFRHVISHHTLSCASKTEYMFKCHTKRS